MKSLLKAIARFFITFGGLRKETPDTITGFFFTGSGASWISQGKGDLLLPEHGWDIKPSISSDGRIIGFQIDNKERSENWRLDFSAPQREKIDVGQYEGATRYPFQQCDAPGLAFSGCGRGNNELTGEFTVLEATIHGDEVISFAAQFTQYDNGITDQWNRGAIRYNSTHSFMPLGYLPI
jgi:hypothetical protein